MGDGLLRDRAARVEHAYSHLALPVFQRNRDFFPCPAVHCPAMIDGIGKIVHKDLFGLIHVPPHVGGLLVLQGHLNLILPGEDLR